MQIFDVRKQAAVATLPEHTDRVLSLAFSENGYYLATGGADSQAICWDLRKLQKNNGCIKKLHVGAPCSSVCFDYSGSYLAVAANDIQYVHASALRISMLRSIRAVFSLLVLGRLLTCCDGMLRGAP